MRKHLMTARIPEHEVVLVERVAQALGQTRSSFIRSAAVGVALYVGRHIDPAEAYARQGEVMALRLKEALAVVEGSVKNGSQEDNNDVRVKVQGYMENCRSYTKAHMEEANDNPRSTELFEEEYVRSRRAEDYHRGGAEAFDRILEEVFDIKTPKAPPAYSFNNDGGTQITRPRIGGGTHPEVSIGVGGIDTVLTT